jgi:hypothetical protein
MNDATRIAINKVAEQVKTAASREIRAAGYKLKASVIKDGIKIIRATSGNLKAHVVATGKPVPLIEFAAREVKGKGVSVSVKEGRKLIQGAFIATMPNGKRIVAVRAPEAKHKKVMKGSKATWSALPIRQLFGPSVPAMIVNKAVEAALFRTYAEKFPKILHHEFKRLSDKTAKSIMKEWQ